MTMVTIHISLETLKRLASATYAMSERNITASHNTALDAETRIACSQVALEQHIAWNDAQCIIEKLDTEAPQREMRLMEWSEVHNDYIQVKRMRQALDETPPWTIEHNGKTYQQGQCSGPTMLIVWYEEKEAE